MHLDNTQCLVGLLTTFTCLFGWPIVEARDLCTATSNLRDHGALFAFDQESGDKTITGVTLIGLSINDELLKDVAKLKYVRRLSLFDTQITDNGIRMTLDMPELRQLAIINTPITNSSIVYISKLARLRNLKLVGTGMTDAGFDLLRAELGKHARAIELDLRHGGYLGVALDNEGNKLLAVVQPGSPAEAAGIMTGDQIRKINGEMVSSLDSLTKLLGQHRPGEIVAIDLRRNEKEIVKRVQLKSIHYQIIDGRIQIGYLEEN